MAEPPRINVLKKPYLQNTSYGPSGERAEAQNYGSLASRPHNSLQDSIDKYLRFDCRLRTTTINPTTGREVVFCHECDAEWWKDESGLDCPACGRKVTEIVSVPQSPHTDMVFG